MRRSIALGAILIMVFTGWLSINPPRVWLNLTKAVKPTAAVGAQLVQKYDCRSCHRIAGQGGLAASNLAGITQRGTLGRVPLRQWLENPRAVQPDTAMPNFQLSDSEIDAIVAYLEQVDQGR